MKRALLILCIGGSLIFGCDAHRKKSHSFNRSKHKNVAYKPANKATAKPTQVAVSNDSNTPKTSDSLVKRSKLVIPSKPSTIYNGASGPGTGGSYASASYRQTEMNRKKYEKRALAELKERQRIMDSLKVEVDSTDYYWNQASKNE